MELGDPGWFERAPDAPQVLGYGVKVPDVLKDHKRVNVVGRGFLVPGLVYRCFVWRCADTFAQFGQHRWRDVHGVDFDE